MERERKYSGDNEVTWPILAFVRFTYFGRHHNEIVILWKKSKSLNATESNEI